MDNWTNPKKVRFEINAEEVYTVYCKLKEVNEENIEFYNTRHPHSLIIKISQPSGTSILEPRYLKYAVIQLCINKNVNFDLCTTGPTHIYSIKRIFDIL